jgi:hypothetical protein
MRRSRFAILFLVYVIAVGLATARLALDFVPPPPGSPTSTTLAMDASRVRTHAWILGILGLPWSALATGCAFVASRGAGLVAGPVAAVALLGGLVAAPLANLALGVAFLVRRRMQRARHAARPLSRDRAD